MEDTSGSEIPIKCLRIVGIDFDKRDLKGYPERSNFVYFGIFATGLVVSTIVNCCVINMNNFIIFLESLGFVLSNMENCSKWFTILFKSKELCILLKGVRKLSNEVTDEEKHQLIAVNGFIRKITKTLLKICLSTAWGIPLSILFFFALDKFVLNTSEAVLTFPYCSAPFFDTSNSMVFSLWFILVVAQGIVYVMVQASVVGLLAFFAINLSEHFKILQNRLRSSLVMKEDMLRLLIRRHVELIDLKEIFNDIFKVTMFIQSLCGSMHLCTIVIQVLLSNEPAKVSGSIPFVINILAELFIFCYSGQIITHESSQIVWAIQESAWYTLPSRSQRSLILMLLRAQKPLIVEAFFFQPSYELFYNILKTTVSYTTMMKAVNA